ncbi:DNA-binding response regulator, LytR/AlgR family [Pedobacter terrae]|uniref:DNA-binding response regulator, LytR/AlgR family n=1 Tax=Pedobacter terrae TaxID=405671 RepID=A0A1G8EJJ6_9SPHI|nr:LytTR family DNA-binding domain-containing protein [Pedobacter terrae]SDH70105.1 DNA-binding response regulator, LytR/AlgR family [Pedobacter terrae]
MIYCIIIDDDPTALEHISEYIAEISWLKISSTFTNPIKALEYIKKNGPVDLLFLDVNMPVVDGIELSNILREKYVKKLIFTTSHAKYALDAFDVNANGFLLKPFNFARFLTEVEKLLPKEYTLDEIHPKEKDYVFVKSKEANFKLVKVKTCDILAIESKLNYIQIHTTNGKITTHMNLKDAKELLIGANELFMQLHRSFIIAMDHIVSIDGNYITMLDGTKFTIGESYKNKLNEFLKNKFFRPFEKETGRRSEKL